MSDTSQKKNVSKNKKFPNSIHTAAKDNSETKQNAKLRFYQVSI